jgi:2-methylfumaryl-CoA isomerase
MVKILQGMRVVEGSAFVAIPLAGMTLAQMGADVIRFDRIWGGLDHYRWPVTKDNKSLFWAELNKGKRSLAVEMATPRGQEIVTRLICAPGPDAGMFLTNLRVRGWMDYDNLKKHRGDLIMVSLLGTRDGRPAVDYTVNPAIGFPFATGPEGSEQPVCHVLPAWDCIAGQTVALALLAAERHRRNTGQGQLVELALKDVALAMLGHLGILGEVMINGVDRAKYGNALYGAYGQDFETADGRRVMVVGLTNRQWDGLRAATGLQVEVEELGLRRQSRPRRRALQGAQRDHCAAEALVSRTLPALSTSMGVYLVGVPLVQTGGRGRPRLLDAECLRVQIGPGPQRCGDNWTGPI